MVNLTLPFPPSVNTYWRSVSRGKRARVILSERGRKYREDALLSLLQAGKPTLGDKRLSVQVWLYRGDKRKYDIDNSMKALLDALQHCGVFDDDEQIDELFIRRCAIDRENPRAEVRITCLEVSEANHENQG